MVDYKNNLLATYYMYICMYESNGHCTALHESGEFIYIGCLKLIITYM